MSTSLYHQVVFGPVHSRRLGLSLGVNLMPLDNKLCSFECIYCECGWRTGGVQLRYNDRQTVVRALRERLAQLKSEGVTPDVITFAGNGEPTMHPEFGRVVEDVIAVRDSCSPTTKISVLSNATMIGRREVREALLKVDNNILKLDSAFDRTAQQINQPSGNYSVASTVAAMKLFEGRLIIQTMFLRGTFRGERVDNTTEQEVSAWLGLVAEIAPRQVMIYTVDRDTPAEDLHKVSVDALRAISARVEALGIPCSVAG